VIAERVARGAALLDARVPGWVDKVNEDTLNIRSMGDCVLGQVFGAYWIGVKALGLKEGFFDTPAGEGGFNLLYTITEYPLLTEEWRRVIRDRKGVPAPEKKEPVLV
jgi:hypothetical protein